MSSEKKKWIITTKRFVAFLDIMGFKDMVARNSHKNIYNSLHAITSDVKQGTHIFPYFLTVLLYLAEIILKNHFTILYGPF